MSEFRTEQLRTQNVFEVSVDGIVNPLEHKAVLAMQATALTVQGAKGATEASHALIGLSQALGVVPTMTYEDLVFRNPLEREIYVMSDKHGQAQDEAAFYVAHRAIESHLAKAISSLTGKEAGISIQHMGSAVKRLIVLHRQLGAEAFAGFRPFFVGLNGYPGPSGLFSAAIPTIDLMVHNGENMPPHERQRLLFDLESGLYPSHQTKELKQRLLDGSETAIDPFVKGELMKLLNAFRKAHRGSVKKFVPQALESQAAGSGGVADVAGYLASKVINTGKGIIHE